MKRLVLPAFSASMAMRRARSSDAFQLIWTVLGARGRGEAGTPSPRLSAGCGAGAAGVTDGKLATWPRSASVSSSGIGLRLNPLMAAAPPARSLDPYLALGANCDLGPYLRSIPIEAGQSLDPYSCYRLHGGLGSYSA
jgi:hypothetical protein